MDFEEFFEDMEKRLRELCGGGCRLERQEFLGVNGTVKHALAVSGDREDVCPCVDMGRYYREYQAGAEPEGLAAHILDACRKEPPVKPGDVSRFLDWESVKGDIYARLINTGKNEGLLRQLVHRQRLDLSLVYYIRVEGIGDGETGTVQIRREYLEQWGVDEETLYRQAWKNLQDAGDAVIEDMEELLVACLGGETCQCAEREKGRMYILGSRDRRFGAVNMCSREMMQMAAALLDGDFWTLPSSIHEVILMPAEGQGMGAQELAALVKEVNDTQVGQDEILSYHVYRYDRERGELVIAA